MAGDPPRASEPASEPDPGPAPAHPSGHHADGVVRRTPLERSLRLAFGDALSKKLERLGLVTVRDLLEHYPRRVVDPGVLTDLASLEEGQHVVLIVDVDAVTARPRRDRRGSVVEIEVTDGVTRLPLIYFAPHAGRVAFIEQRLRPGQRITADGVVKSRGWQLQIVHPEIEEVDTALSEAEIAQRATLPRVRYGQTKGLNSATIQTAIRAQLDRLPDEALPDPVPFEVRMDHGLLTHATALRALHAPESMRDYRAARDALRFEEAFVLQAAMARRRAAAAAQPATSRPIRPGGILDTFDTSLPFALTAGQLEVGGVVSGELAQSAPMHRLLQGEVGSGKTLVALRAMLQVVDAGGQAALLAPTEVLAAQHERSIRALMGPLAEGGMLGGARDATRVVLLTGSMPAARRRAALAEAASGSAGIVIGTHALLQENVQLADLGLVVVDEQHRFGVEQRDALRAKGRTSPHLLVMTATPIPRTVAMTIFGDLEVSTLREIPAGRAEVLTHVVQEGNERWMARIWARIREEVDKGGRAYVVCPRISATTAEEGADLLAAESGEEPEMPDGGTRPPGDVASVEAMVERMRATPDLAGIAIGALHGRMTAEEKDAAMAAFASGRVPVLVCTTVVEVGVDVPEASVMVVFDSDRFGLSQLHQLRGRIGRGPVPGVCLVVTQLPTTPQRDPQNPDKPPRLAPAVRRLSTFADTRDGFVLAEADLAQRSEGDVLGAAQHGRSSGLRILRVVTDQAVIEQARDAARAIVAADPDLAEHPELAEAIERTLEGEREEFLERS